MAYVLLIFSLQVKNELENRYTRHFTIALPLDIEQTFPQRREQNSAAASTGLGETTGAIKEVWAIKNGERGNVSKKILNATKREEKEGNKKKEYQRWRTWKALDENDGQYIWKYGYWNTTSKAMKINDAWMYIWEYVCKDSSNET